MRIRTDSDAEGATKRPSGARSAPTSGERPQNHLLILGRGDGTSPLNDHSSAAYLRVVRRRAVFAALLAAAAWLAPDVARAQPLEAADPEQRAGAARAAGERGDRSAIPRLIELLADDDSRVRAAAAEALGWLGAREALTKLMVRAQVDSSERVRRAAAEAVRAIDPTGYVATISSQDKPPVASKPLPPLRPRARRAVLLTLGAEADALRFSDSVAASSGVALRWGDIEAQVSVRYPRMGLSGELRWLLIRYPRMTPLLGLGASLAFGDARAPPARAVLALSLIAGFRYYFIPPIFVQAELHAAWVVRRPHPAGGAQAIDAFSLPIVVRAGLELWP